MLHDHRWLAIIAKVSVAGVSFWGFPGLVPYGGSFCVQWAGMVYAACKEHSGAAFNQKVFAGVSALFARYSNWGVIVAGVIIAGVSFAGVIIAGVSCLSCNTFIDMPKYISGLFHSKTRNAQLQNW